MNPFTQPTNSRPPPFPSFPRATPMQELVVDNSANEDSTLLSQNHPTSYARNQFQGQRDPNNPKENLKKCQDVIITKRANYVSALTCGCCVAENIYKVFATQQFEYGVGQYAPKRRGMAAINVPEGHNLRKKTSTIGYKPETLPSQGPDLNGEMEGLEVPPAP